ncbi:MAG: alpha/beta hydrolase [Sediminibacterium sp.]
MRLLKIVILSIFTLFVIYFLGPQPPKPVLNDILPTVASINELNTYVSEMESMHSIKPNNEAKIIWADSSKSQTEYAIVYLHGFSASQMEGDPVHQNMAKQFHCNLYLARLAEHGIDTTENLMNLTAENYWESAKMAYAIGKQIGKKVILMSTSTGGTLALQLAANYPEIAGLILYSPNIEVFNPAAPLLNNPWGLQIGRAVLKGKYVDVKYTDSAYPKYWNSHYRIEAVVALQNLLEATMTETTFKKIHQPTLALYYYKDEAHQDNVVKVSAIQKMMQQIATPDHLKLSMALPNTGNHVLASPIVSKDILSVEKATAKFIQEKIIK